MTFIPKVFKVSGLVTLTFLRDEAALLPDGAELRATTRAKLVVVIPEFNSYWYEGCKIYDTDQHHYCRKPVGPRARLFTGEEKESTHRFFCERGDTMFWRFKICVDDNKSRLEGVIAQAVAYVLSEGDCPLWPHHFQSKYPHPDQQAEFFKAKEASGTWFVFDVVYKKCEDIGDFTFTYAKYPSQTESTHVFPRPDGRTKWVNPPLFPTTILQMDLESSVKTHVLAGKDFANTNGECTLDPPEEYVLCPEGEDECLGSFEAKDNCIETKFERLNLTNPGVLSTNAGRVAQWKTEGLEEAIQSLKTTIQGLENLKNSLVVQLRLLQEKAFEHYQ
ncbi:unnamed protein product [Calypogeia fissa]